MVKSANGDGHVPQIGHVPEGNVLLRIVMSSLVCAVSDLRLICETASLAQGRFEKQTCITYMLHFLVFVLVFEFEF